MKRSSRNPLSACLAGLLLAGALFSPASNSSSRHNGIARAYPVTILNWHEIVNDR